MVEYFLVPALLSVCVWDFPVCVALLSILEPTQYMC